MIKIVHWGALRLCFCCECTSLDLTWRRERSRKEIIKHRFRGVLVCSDLLCPVPWARCGLDGQVSFCADRRHDEYRYVHPVHAHL